MHLKQRYHPMLDPWMTWPLAERSVLRGHGFSSPCKAHSTASDSGLPMDLDVWPQQTCGKQAPGCACRPHNMRVHCIAICCVTTSAVQGRFPYDLAQQVQYHTLVHRILHEGEAAVSRFEQINVINAQQHTEQAVYASLIFRHQFARRTGYCRSRSNGEK